MKVKYSTHLTTFYDPKKGDPSNLQVPQWLTLWAPVINFCDLEDSYQTWQSS